MQTAPGKALFHVNKGNHLKIIVENSVNDPVGSFMHLAQAGLNEFMDGVSSGGRYRRTLCAELSKALLIR